MHSRHEDAKMPGRSRSAPEEHDARLQRRRRQRPLICSREWIAISFGALLAGLSFGSPVRGDVNLNLLSSPAFSACDCNLTPLCDPGCLCCDPDCPQLASFCGRNESSLLAAGGGSSSSNGGSSGLVCPKGLVAVRNPYVNSLTGLSDGLCVLYNNNPSLGAFFQPNQVPLLGDAASLNLALGSPPSELLTDPSAAFKPALIAAPYSVNSSLAILLATDASLTGVLSVPRPMTASNPVQFGVDGSTQCLDAGPTKFLQSTSSSCTRDLSDVSLCAAFSPLDPAVYLNVALLRDPSAASPAVAPVTILQPWQCAAGNGTACCVGGATVSGDCANSTVAAAALPAPALQLNGTVCANVVTHVDLTVAYTATSNTSMVIDQVLFRWATATVSRTAANSVAAQRFAIRFVPSNATGSAAVWVRLLLALSNSTSTPVAKLSGNPGYRPGLPVNFLAQSTSSVGPLPLASPSGAAGLCAIPSASSLNWAVPTTYGASTLAGTSWDSGRAVQFGVDTESSCTMQWAGPAAATAAAASTGCLAMQQFLPLMMGNVTHVARFGNMTAFTAATAATATTSTDEASGTDTAASSVATATGLGADWIPLVGSWATAAASLMASGAGSGSAAGTTATTGTGATIVCPQVPTLAVLELVWADAGALRAPQPMVVGARASLGAYTQVAWSTCASPSACAAFRAGNTSTAPPISVNTRVSIRWTRVGAERLADYVPPAPELLPPLPRDWFYPFFL